MLFRHLRLRAATGSMHQFLNSVRAIYPDVVADDMVEAATIFLYERAMRTVFGSGAAAAFRARIRALVKFAAPYEIEARIGRIESQFEAFTAVRAARSGTPIHAEFTRHVECAIRALLLEADPKFDDPEVIRLVFPRFELAFRRFVTHLRGIQRQSVFLMKTSRSPA